MGTRPWAQGHQGAVLGDRTAESNGMRGLHLEVVRPGLGLQWEYGLRAQDDGLVKTRLGGQCPETRWRMASLRTWTGGA